MLNSILKKFPSVISSPSLELQSLFFSRCLENYNRPPNGLKMYYTYEDLHRTDSSFQRKRKLNKQIGPLHNCKHSSICKQCSMTIPVISFWDFFNGNSDLIAHISSCINYSVSTFPQNDSITIFIIFIVILQQKEQKKERDSWFWHVPHLDIALWKEAI